MKNYFKHLLLVIVCMAISAVCFAEQDYIGKGLSFEERMKLLEERFFAAAKEGKIITGILVEGNSLFNGTTAPQNNYNKPYTDEELRAAKFSAERNSKVFLLAKDGTLYYPTCKKGQQVSMSLNSPRIPRILTEEQKKGPKMFTWATLVPMVGREVEVFGEVYPGYGGVKAIAIESIKFEGDYIEE